MLRLHISAYGAGRLNVAIALSGKKFPSQQHINTKQVCKHMHDGSETITWFAYGYFHANILSLTTDQHQEPRGNKAQLRIA